MKQIYLLFPFLCLTNLLFAQPSNDDCDTPIVLDDVSNWCSDDGAFTTFGATPSGYGAPSCFSGEHNDLWFTFVAGATDMTVFIRGNTSVAPGGTLPGPEVALYTANCGGVINELGCETDNEGNGSVELYEGGLIPGLQYLIRVQGRNAANGSFQLCINNFFPPAEITSDCPTASVLCDKAPFVVEAVSSAGVDNTEMDGATCFFNGAPGTNESNSTWFSWICQESGPLTFTLTPLSEDDDLDFVLYELPNGIEDCSNKVEVRCMAAGSFNFPSPCMGPTGLAEGFDQTSMDAGCNDPDDVNFLAPLDMVQGTAYALVVNNFTSTGNSFQIEFGGLGTFRGPEPAFESDEPDNKVCVGEEIQFTDASVDGTGTINNWEWTFGANASQQDATGPGPHAITYDEPGLKSVVLIIETELGCRVAEVATFEVTDPVEIEPAFVQPDCGGGTNGEIDVDVTAGGGPFTYAWSIPGAGNTNAVDGLPEGAYSLQITDEEGCTYDYDFELAEPGLALDGQAEPVIPPTCAGDADGQITISATEGTYPYSYDFGDGFQSDSIRGGFAAGTYGVTVQDVNGCDEAFTIEVVDPAPLTLQTTPTDVSCNGQNDGMGNALPDGGHGTYTYEWSDGQTTATAEGLSPGDYSVTVTDRFGCAIEQQITIDEPPPSDLTLVGTTNPICFGEQTGTIEVVGVGGLPPYTYSTDGVNFQTAALLTGFGAGVYTVFQQDANGCISTLEDVEITQPAELTVDAGEDQVINLGETATIRTVISPVSLVDYTWRAAPDTVECLLPDCSRVLVAPVRTQEYTVTIRDDDGCEASDVLLIRVLPVRDLYAPNGFSPNDDGVNDFFTLFAGRSVRRITELRIYNRWGDLLWEGTDLEPGVERMGWDGTFNGRNLNPGVFVYSAVVEYIDDQVINYSGDVTLLR